MAAGAAVAGLAYLIYTNWEKVTSWFRETWTRFVEWLTGLWDKVRAVGETIWDIITLPTRTALAWLREAWDAFASWWHSWWDRLVAWVRGAVDRLLAPILTIIDWVRKALDWLGRLFGAQATASSVPAAPAIPNATISGSGLPKLATGGIATRPIMADIAETEPEAVIPLSRLPSIIASLGGTAGGPVTIVVELDSRTLARAVLPEMHREIVLRTGLA
jgi:hypothetical protein